MDDKPIQEHLASTIFTPKASLIGNILTPEELAHDRLLYIRFYDHYSQDENCKSIEDFFLECVGWFVEENDKYIKIAWQRAYFKNIHDDKDGDSCMHIVKSTIVDQKEIDMV